MLNEIERLRAIADAKERRWKMPLVEPVIGKCFKQRDNFTVVVLGRSPWADAQGERVFIGFVCGVVPVPCCWYSHGGFRRTKEKSGEDLVEFVEDSGHNNKLECSPDNILT